MDAVAQQPVAIQVDANKTIFQHYKSGVIQGAGCGTDLDHIVLAVGYGTTSDGIKYWKAPSLASSAQLSHLSTCRTCSFVDLNEN